MKNLLVEFKPALLFLGKFLVIYFAGNVLYGVFIELYGNSPDPLTTEMSRQTSWFLNGLGQKTNISWNSQSPLVSIQSDAETVVNMYEGCNGLNVMIIFCAFLVAFGGSGRSLLWFLPLGIAIIHLVNLARIALLYYAALYRPTDFYYLHKYFFTGILYVIVFTLWVVWVLKFQPKVINKGVV